MRDDERQSVLRRDLARLYPTAVLREVMEHGVIGGRGRDSWQVGLVPLGTHRLAVYGVRLMRVLADPPIELDVRHLEPPVAVGDVVVQAVYQPNALVAIEQPRV